MYYKINSKTNKIMEKIINLMGRMETAEPTLLCLRSWNIDSVAKLKHWFSKVMRVTVIALRKRWT